MADDDKTPEEGAPTPPAFDAKALGDQISTQVAAGVAEALKNQPQRAPQPQYQPPAEPEDALASVIEPYIARGTARANLIAQLASDKADFYTPSDADELEDRLAFKDEIEKRALGLAQMGKALPREDIYKHLKGEKFSEFVERSTTRTKKRQDRARQEGGDDGQGGIPQGRGGQQGHLSVDRAYTLSGEGKLEKELEDKAF